MREAFLAQQKDLLETLSTPVSSWAISKKCPSPPLILIAAVGSLFVNLNSTETLHYSFSTSSRFQVTPPIPLSWQEATVLKLHLKTSPGRDDLENQFLAFSLESGIWRGIHARPVDDWQLFRALREPENGGQASTGRPTVKENPVSAQRYLSLWRLALQYPTLERNLAPPWPRSAWTLRPAHAPSEESLAPRPQF